MTITVIADNRMGILSRLAVTLGRADMRIERQSRSEIEADRVSFVFDVVGAEPTGSLGETLRGIPHVLEVTIEGDEQAAQTSALPATAAALPQPEVDALIRSYPNLVSGVRNVQQRLELDATGWHELGEQVGGGLVRKGVVKPVKTDSLAFALERLVLPAVKPFSLAKAAGDTLSITVNPFAQGVSSEGVNCYFLSGLIGGLLGSAIPGATTVERTCRAAGNAACTFVTTTR